MAKETDDAVMKLLVTVEKKKNEIKALKQKPQWLTNCSFGYETPVSKRRIGERDEDSHDRVNIQTRRDVDELLGFYSLLLQKEEYLHRAATELGVKTELKHMNFTIADWKADLKTRIGQLSIEQKQKEIDELDNRVNKLVSPDQRREMELKAIQELLGE